VGIFADRGGRESMVTGGGGEIHHGFSRHVSVVVGGVKRWKMGKIPDLQNERLPSQSCMVVRGAVRWGT